MSFLNTLFGYAAAAETDTDGRAEIVVGNTAVSTADDQWDWEVFVRDEGSVLREVTFTLHPTFHSPVVRVDARRNNKFSLRRRGWGTFQVGVEVLCIDGTRQTFSHMLRFGADAGAAQQTHALRLAAAAPPPSSGSDRLPPAAAFRDPQLAALLGRLDRAAAGPAWAGRRMEASSAAMHGYAAEAARGWVAPRLVVECDAEARPGYQTMMAHEYADEPAVLRAKVKVLAEMIGMARACCAYTGAGISTASGIDDYASKAEGSVAMRREKVSGFDAEPTLAHRVLAALHRAGHLKHWVQQNHDGLPQKAGFPPEHLNEIHGAWYDPSNPVVPMEGSLRGDLMAWLREWEQKTDLCLAMGTSLCGMNADRMVVTPARKAVQRRAVGLGAVIVSLQRTQHDEQSALRIYAKIDEVMALLAREMGLDVRPKAPYAPVVPAEGRAADGVYKVPYDSEGRLVVGAGQSAQMWDLRAGAEVRVTAGPGRGYVGVVVGRGRHGHFRVMLPLQREGHPARGKKWTVYVLGSWWLETAVNGKAPLLPVVNTGRRPPAGWDQRAPSAYHVPTRQS